MAKSLKRAVLITGAASGIGAAFARLCASEYPHLLLVDRDESALHRLCVSLKDQHPDVTVEAWLADLTDSDIAVELHDKIAVGRYQVELLINNAGFGSLGFFSDLDWHREQAMIRIHVETLTHLTKLCLKDMIVEGSGAIINVASVAGFVPSPLMAVYNATKAYILSFSEALANEVSTLGITVTTLCPGLTRTGFQQRVGAGEPAFTKSSWLSMDPDDVARYGMRAMRRGKTIAVPGHLNRFVVLLYRWLPRQWVVRAVRRVQESNRTFLANN
jgi:short-subunit dehydrogenase